MTHGGFGAIAVALRAIVEAGDEVIFLTPPWFFYEVLIIAAGGVPVRVPLAPPAFDIDLAAIDAAITPEDPGDHLQHAAQPERPGLPAAGPRGAGGDAPHRVRAHRPARSA